MVRIRLRRAGGKGQPTHRIVAADKESPRDGRFIEILGDYNPRTEPATIRVKEDRVYYWLSVGAQPSNSVLQIFRVVGLMERYQRYKDGEDIEVLVAEGKQVEKDRNIDPRTRRDDLVKKSPPKKKEKPGEEDLPEEAEVEVEAVEVEPEPETEVEAEPEPEAEPEVESVEAEPEPEAEPEVELVEVEPEPEPEPEAEVDAVEGEPEPEPEPEVESVEVEPEPEVEEVVEEEPQVEVKEETAPQEEQKEETPEPALEVKITDAAKKLAEEAGIDLAKVKGSGKDGNILKSDITKLIQD